MNETLENWKIHDCRFFVQFNQRKINKKKEEETVKAGNCLKTFLKEN